MLEEKLEAVRKVTELEVLCVVICCKTENLSETNVHSCLSAYICFVQFNYYKCLK